MARQTISVEELIRLNPGVWLETHGWVRGVTGKLERPRLNILQRRILAIYLSRLLKGLPCRVVGLKPRKKGFSTMVSAIHYSQLQNYPHEGVVIGNKLATSEEIYGMIRLFAETDDFAGQWGSPFDANNDRIKWEHSAKLTQETANAKDTCRGKTPQFLHGSEVAHWEGADVSLTSALNALPDEGFNCAFLESTPFGATGTFAVQWNGARWPTADECPDGIQYWKQWASMCPDQAGDQSGLDDRNFVRVFAAWYEFEGSRMTLNEEQKQRIQDTLDGESWYEGERELIKVYGNEGPRGMRLGTEVSDCDVWEQLAWRRMIIQTKCKPKSTRKFDEEYPRDPKSCFLSSGHQVFDADALADIQIMCRTRPAYGQLDEREERASWIHMPEESSTFWMWEKPTVGCRYIIPVDLAEGEDQTKGNDPDRHSAIVLRDAYLDHNRCLHPIKVAARIKPPNRMPIPAFTRLVRLLSIYYGRCTVIPEMNNTGLAFITAYQMMPNPPPLWQRTEIDPHGGRQRRWTGWRTTDNAEYGGLRATIIWHLHEILRNRGLDCACPHIHGELVDFVDKNGRMEAGSGHDDDVLTLAIGVYNIAAATIYAEPVREFVLPPDLAAAERLESMSQPGSAMRW